MTYQELGEVYLRAGDYKQAEEHFQKSLAVRKKMYGKHHGHIAQAQMMLAETNHKQQEYDKALGHVQRALQVLAPDFVSSDSHVNPSLERITGYFALQKTLKLKGEILQDMANEQQSLSQKAKRNFETALNCYEKVLQLYNLLMQPVLTQIASKDRLVIIPDGLLYYVPFEALLTKNAKHDKVDFTSLDYLIRRFEISYHYSATLYQQTLTGQGQSQLDDLMAFAPVFNQKNNNGTILSGNADVFADMAESEKLAFVTRDGSQFQELKHSESEVQTIVKLFEDRDKGSMAYFHDQASEENFKANAGKFRYLHVSTHGFMNEENPRLSGLAFSQPVDSTPAEDGILYSAEVFNLELNADLIVLSSCESGIGKLAKGEGMLSMTRGFLYSGAKNVVVSLWKVFDEHTSKLMIEFYRGVVTGESYAGALRKAKLKMLENPETALPASWASFVLVGE